ncbi:MAG: tyrosine-type recombinase/integrase [Alphaproteobacteria bacterium]|nr:tyrosine-type recombinase/integrase [Alphaproteobacteria bacterium]
MPKLDRSSIAKLTPPPPGKFDIVHWDDDMPGLGVRILKSGSRSWVVRYRIGLRQRVVNLGKTTGLSPGRARSKAGEILAQAKLGHDFQADRKARTSQAKPTFGRLSAEFIRRYVEVVQRPRTRLETRRLLAKWQHLDDLAIEDVSRAVIAEGLARVEEQSGLVTRNRARSAVSRLFGWAMQEGLADHNPVVDTAVRPETPRDRVLKLNELKEIWAATDGPGDYNCIIRLLILTGQRRAEVAGITWEEVEFEGALWRIPSMRTKNGRGHDVPLSDEALSILTSVGSRDGRALIFGEGSGPFSGWSKSKERLDKRCGVTGWRLHDLRRTVVTGMAELGTQPHVIEAVVNHVSGHKAGVAGIYNRAIYAREKREALKQWSTYLMNSE